MAACFLGLLGVPAFGIVSLVAFGLWIAGKTSAARITFASGVMGAALVAALATLSFLERGMGYHREGSDPTIVLAALTLVVAGAGQFLAALRRPHVFGAAFGFAAVSMVLLAIPMAGADLFRLGELSSLFFVSSPSLPWLPLGLALSTAFAVPSLLIAVVPAERRNRVLATLLAALGGIAGFSAAEAAVTTHCTVLQGLPGGLPARVRVEVDVFGVPMGERTGFARIPREGADMVRSVSRRQPVWVVVPLVVGAVAGTALGFGVAWGIGHMKGQGAAGQATAPRVELL